MHQPSLLMPPSEIAVPKSTAIVSAAWDALQERAFGQLLSAAVPGLPTVGAAPTGFGKTKLAKMLLQRLVIPNDWPWIFYTHRRALFKQTLKSFAKEGIQFGCRAAEHDELLWMKGQMAMLPTERSAIGGGKRMPHNAKFVLIDEAHANCDPFTKGLIEYHLSQGAIVIGLTATPVGMKAGGWKKLEVLCTNSELRKAGGILYADCVTPTMVDLRHIAKKTAAGDEFSQVALGKAFAIQQVVGQVYEHWKELNPHALPALLFAPGVKESMWFVDQFQTKGIKAAHIDGDDVYLGEKDSAGEPVVYKSNEKMREHVKELSEKGKVQIVCNRFVFREGVDWPHLYHGIFATAFSLESSWVQSCLDEQTEVLTNHGWKHRNAILDDDLIAGMDLHTERTVWSPILGRVHRQIDASEQMVEIKSPHLDVRVTTSHDMVFRNPNTAAGSYRWDVAEASRFLTKAGAYHIPVAAQESVPKASPLTDSELRYLGWWLSDGTHDKSNSTVSISQSSAQPQAYHDSIISSLVGCGFDYRVQRVKRTGKLAKYADCIRYLSPKRSWGRLAKFLDKRLAQELLETVTSSQLGVLLETLNLGDGNKFKTADYTPRVRVITTGDKEFADRFQALCVTRGFRCNITVEVSGRMNPIYQLRIRPEFARAMVGGSYKEEGRNRCRMVISDTSPGEWVWCLTTTCGTLITRRNGKVAIVGNCGRILRSYPGYKNVLIQDHGGNCIRPGLESPNLDREWSLDDTGASRSKKAKKDRKEGDTQEPPTCPNCRRPISWKLWSKNGNKCPVCSHKFSRSVKWVQQTDGKLVRHVTSATKVKRKNNDPQKAWDGIYFPSRNSKSDRSSTFTQLLARFRKSHPQFRVFVDHGRDVVSVVDPGGERTVLRNVPKPSSAAWDVRVKNVGRGELQQGE